MLAAIAWRNVWRSRTRSLVILIAISLGIFAGVFFNAFMAGMMNQRVENVIKTELSHIQIHAPEYTETLELEKHISNGIEIRNTLLKNGSIEAVSNRLLTSAMLTSAETGAGVRVMGVVPEHERQVSNMHEKIIEGKYFEGIKRNPILLGKKLARKLNVKLRSKLVLTLTQSDGTITYGAFRVAGIFESVNSTYDEMNVFVRKSDLSKLIQYDENICHEIAIYLNNHDAYKQIGEKISKLYSNLEVKTWVQLSPEMKMVEGSMAMYLYIFLVIILLALLFGIINTMLMVILERVKELGMLMAVGMTRTKVFFMILLETVYLSTIGGVVGALIGYGVSIIYETRGIDLSKLYGQGLAAYGYDPVIYTYITFDVVINVTIMVIITGIIAALFPARKALKLNPAEAIRTDM